MFPKKRRGRRQNEFRKLEDDLAEMIRMFEEMNRGSFNSADRSEPYVYGFSVRFGPEGKPSIEEFDNIPKMIYGERHAPGEREPLTDVINREKELSVIVELPGVEKKEIGLKTGETSLEINVDTPRRKYHKMIALPARVKADSTRATCNNGILEVRIEKAEADRGAGL